LLAGIAAILYTTSTTTAWLAGRAGMMAAVDEALTQAEVAHHQLAQALILATDLEAGITTEAAVEGSVGRARQSLINLKPGLPELSTVAAVYADSGLRMLELIDSDNLAGARLLAGGGVIANHDTLATTLTTTRNELLAEIERARSISGLTATVTGVMVVLLMPVAMVVIYRVIARRYLRRVELETKLTSERELSRSKDEFIANISHELRTPLTSIYGFAHVLEEGSMLGQDGASELLQVIITQAGELERMVEDLLATARMNAGVLSYHLQSVHLENELAQVISALDRSLESGRGLGAIPVDLESAPVLADPIRIRQVLRNLIANAQKHGGRNITVKGEVVGDHYELAVIDDGPGVPDHLLSAMFTRFMHSGDTPLVAGSVGLGLHIARSLANGMGGDIEYRRRNGLTNFVLILSRPTTAPTSHRQDVVVHV
jgi:signal transduction histidine kinase